MNTHSKKLFEVVRFVLKILLGAYSEKSDEYTIEKII